MKRELKVPEISGSEADGTGFLRLDCCAQRTPYLHLCQDGGAAVVQCFSLRFSAHCCGEGWAAAAGLPLTSGARRVLPLAVGGAMRVQEVCVRSADTLVGADFCARRCYASGRTTCPRRRWGQGCVRPVLKHGPRSLTCVRVCTIQSCTRSEGTGCDIGYSGRPRSSGRGLSKSTFVRTRKMVNYACVG